MIQSLSDLAPILPELLLLATIVIVMLADLWIDERRRGVLHAISLGGLVLTAVAVLRDFNPGESVSALTGLMVRDGMGDLMKLFILLISGIVLVYAKHSLRTHKLFVGEFYLLFLFAVLGMFLLVASDNLIMLYLGLELLALSSYALVALDRDSPVGAESAMKYFVLGAIASGLLLYGMSMLYGLSGTLQLDGIATALAEQQSTALLAFALTFVVIGLAFKFGAVPFHMWIPDVYQGAPTAVTLFIASAPKIAAVGMAFRLLQSAMPSLASDWSQMLSLMALLSLVLGNLAAIAQTNLKRMLAYSTISHVGFIFLALLGGGDGYAAASFYTFTYALMTAGAFGVIIALSRQGFEAAEIDDYRGLNQRHPWLAFIMLLLMASLAGVPPMVGFFSKLLVLQNALAAGYLWLVIVAAVMAVVGAYYYLRVIKVMYFDAPVEEVEFRAPGDLRFVLSLNGLSQLALGLFWGPLIALCLRVWG
jgi:NADH-quinone oxidoreductase subunit N